MKFLYKTKIFMFAVLFLMMSGLSMAATYNVTSTIDSIDANPGDGICADSLGRCTLRAAIDESNANPTVGPNQYNQIKLDDDTYAIAIANTHGNPFENNNRTGDFDIKVPVQILGMIGGNTVISGSHLDRIFHIQNADANLALSHVTLKDGWARGMEHNWGNAILSEYGAELMIIKSNIVNNGNPNAKFEEDGYGTTIEHLKGGRVKLIDVNVGLNSSGQDGMGNPRTVPIAFIASTDSEYVNLKWINNSGGLFALAYGQQSNFSLKNSDFKNNYGAALKLSGDVSTKDYLEGEISKLVISGSQKDRGLIADPFSQIVIKDAEIKNNHGGVNCTDCKLFLNRVTLEKNEAIKGAGVYVTDAPTDLGYPDQPKVILQNSTCSQNIADENGGCLYSLAGSPIDIVSSTIHLNTAGESGGGVYVAYPNSTPAVTMRSSIIAGNQAFGSYSSPDADCGDNTGGASNSIKSFDDNMIGYDFGSTVCSINWGGAMNDQKIIPPFDPKLDALAYNGGFGRTHAPKAGSPAIDPTRVVDDCLQFDGVSILAFDQNLDSRPHNNKCDIGSVEF